MWNLNLIFVNQENQNPQLNMIKKGKSVKRFKFRVKTAPKRVQQKKH